MRYRSSGGLTLSKADYMSWHGNCSQTTDTVTGQTAGIKIGTQSEMYDEVVPNFHKRVQNGEVFFTPMNSAKWNVTIAGDSARRRAPANSCSNPVWKQEVWSSRTVVPDTWVTLKGYQDRVPWPPSLISDNDISRAFSEASTKVASQRGRSKTNLYETLAEANKSLALLPGMFKSARKVLVGKGMSSFNAVPTLGDAKNQADLYLAWRYGLRPILQDITGVLEGLEKIGGTRRESTRSQIILKENKIETLVSTSLSETSTINCSYTDIVTVRAMSLDEYKADVLFDIGFSAKNLITLPWELVRYSFVVDWFVNVGDALGALAPSLGFTQLGSCVTTERSRLATVNAGGTGGGTQNWTVLRPETGSLSSSLVTKARTTALGSPTLVLKNDFRFDKLDRCLDALALVTQRLK